MARHLLLVVASIAFVAVLSSAPQALSEDGPHLVEQLVLADGIARWYHAAYLPLAQALGALPFVAGEVHALAAASALASVAALAFAAATARRLGGSAWVPVLLLVGSSGWWVNAARVEVHGQQLFGAALLLWAAARFVADERRPARATTSAAGACAVLAVAAFVATISHRTNPGLLPVVALLWWRRVPFGRAAGGVACLGAGLLAGVLANDAAGILRGGSEGDLWLIETFRTSFTWEFLLDELLAPWAAPLFGGVFAIAFGGATARRLVVGALPLLAFFVWFGISTAGGYFGGVALALSVAAGVAWSRFAGATVEGSQLAASQYASDEDRAPSSSAQSVGSSAPFAGPRRAVVACGLLVALVFSLGGATVGARTLWSESRRSFDALARERVERLCDGLELPIHVVVFEPDRQTVTGRVHGLVAHNLVDELIILVEAGATPAGFAERTMTFVREVVEGGERIAIDGGWREWGALDPRVGAYMTAIEDAFRANFEVRECGDRFLVAEPFALR